MKQYELIYTLDEVEYAARELFNLMDDCAVFTFTGSLGAGKTTLIQALLSQCGVEENIQSPTFTYVSEYANTEGQSFYHFDLYRLKDAHDFKSAGFGEYLYAPNSWAFIEWPEIIMPLLKKRVCHIAIDHLSDNNRRLRYVIV